MVRLFVCPLKPTGVVYLEGFSLHVSLCRLMTVGLIAAYQSCFAWFQFTGSGLPLEPQHAACLLLVSAISALSQATLEVSQSGSYHYQHPGVCVYSLCLPSCVWHGNAWATYLHACCGICLLCCMLLQWQAQDNVALLSTIFNA